MAKVVVEPGVEYVEYGYVIQPYPRRNQDDRVMYPFISTLRLPKGYQLSGAKSQNDPVRFNCFDDIIRIYALVPSQSTELIDVDIYIVPTGMSFKSEERLHKLTIVKEKEGQFIWHIYYKAESET